MPIPLWAIMAGLGAAKSEFLDRPAAEKQRRSALLTLKYSPWTGRQANLNIQEPDTLGEAVKGGLAGYMANPEGSVSLGDFGGFGGSTAAPMVAAPQSIEPSRGGFSAFMGSPSISAQKQAQVGSMMAPTKTTVSMQEFAQASPAQRDAFIRLGMVR